MGDHLRVHGGARLVGEVNVVGAKNSVLKLMAAALLAEGTTTITNCPEILDVPLMADVLRSLGCEVRVDHDVVSITTPGELAPEADYASVSKLRASVCVLGPLVARCRRAVVPLPGGDAIGSRPLDMHQNGLAKLGAHSTIEHGRLVAEAAGLHGAQIWLDFPSVGATENILMASVLADGTTVIDNAAREPEIVDLCVLLQQMGAKISGAGTSTLTVHGVQALAPTEHRVLGDRIVGATWAFAAAMTRGDIRVRGVDPHHLDLVLEKLRMAGAEVSLFGRRPKGGAEPSDAVGRRTTGGAEPSSAVGRRTTGGAEPSDAVGRRTTGGAEPSSAVADVDNQPGFRVMMEDRPRSVDFVTLPYPGFATDLQPMAIALSSISEGTSMITENVFEARFRFVEEMVRLGADARTDGHHAVVRGVERLSSAPVWASDIRAGAGLVLAGLCADSVTEVWDVFHIDRGYPRFVEDLNRIGARVERVAAPPRR